MEGPRVRHGRLRRRADRLQLVRGLVQLGPRRQRALGAPRDVAGDLVLHRPVQRLEAHALLGRAGLELAEQLGTPGIPGRLELRRVLAGRGQPLPQIGEHPPPVSQAREFPFAGVQVQGAGAQVLGLAQAGRQVGRGAEPSTQAREVRGQRVGVAGQRGGGVGGQFPDHGVDLSKPGGDRGILAVERALGPLRAEPLEVRRPPRLRSRVRSSTARVRRRSASRRQAARSVAVLSRPRRPARSAASAWASLASAAEGRSVRPVTMGVTSVSRAEITARRASSARLARSALSRWSSAARRTCRSRSAAARRCCSARAAADSWKDRSITECSWGSCSSVLRLCPQAVAPAGQPGGDPVPEIGDARHPAQDSVRSMPSVNSMPCPTSGREGTSRYRSVSGMSRWFDDPRQRRSPCLASWYGP